MVMGVPKNGWISSGKIPLEWMIWGSPYVRNPPICSLPAVHTKISTLVRAPIGLDEEAVELGGRFSFFGENLCDVKGIHVFCHCSWNVYIYIHSISYYIQIYTEYGKPKFVTLDYQQIISNKIKRLWRLLEYFWGYSGCTDIYIHTCMHRIALHCIALHDITLHYITLHYIHTHIHTCMHACIHTYIIIHPYMHTCIHWCIHAYINTLHYITFHYITLHYITLHTNIQTYI